MEKQDWQKNNIRSRTGWLPECGVCSVRSIMSVLLKRARKSSWLGLVEISTGNTEREKLPPIILQLRKMRIG